MSEVMAATASGNEQQTFPPVRCPFGAQPAYERLRGQGTLRRVRTVAGETVWWATRHADVRAILADRRFSSNRRHENFPLFNGDPQARERFRQQPIVMLGMDGDEHAKSRRAVIGEFTVKRLAALGPRIQQIVDHFVDELLAAPQHPVDLVSAFSLPVPSLVICELLGVPYEDHDFFQQHSGTLLRRSTAAAQRQQAADELRDYLDRLLTIKQTRPSDDLLSRQIARQRAEGGIGHEELVSLAVLLLIAGHETTANMISLGTVGLLNNPDQLAAIRADPGAIPLAVEEMLRFFSIADAIGRIAVEDVEIGGVTIRAGEGVVASTLAADWDRGTFATADELDVRRGARHHVAFGYGPHQCLGQNLARQELQIVFDTLFRRIPDLRVAVPLAELPFKDDGVVYGVYELPVTW